MKKNNLLDWCKDNGKEYLIYEWDTEKNREELGLEIEDVSYGSDKKVWWRCSDYNHSWSTYVRQRTQLTKRDGNDCSICNNREVYAGFNDLKTWAIKNNKKHLIDEWDVEKNSEELGLKIEDVMHGMAKKVWWKCSEYGHSWQAVIYSRSYSNMCPICEGKKVLIGFNDLATTNPRIAEEWHPTKNGNMRSIDVVAGSNKKAWWKCKKHGHEWVASIISRSNGSKCPYCVNQKVLAGFNDLATINPRIAEEWHPTKNGNMKSTDVVAGSNKKAWWKCKKHGHEWIAIINSRTSHETDCPYCNNKKVLKGFNDLVTTNPQLAEEWHPTKNGSLMPTQFTKGSGKRIWWRCKDHGHEWQVPIATRNTGTDCSVCNGNVVLVGFNDLATTNPKLAEEWHPTKNGSLKPTQFSKGSSRQRVWWKCKKHGHEWQSTIANRAENNCPYCSNQKALMGFNDLATTNPKLAKEWHPTKNGNLKPTEITEGSNKKIWWKCEKHGHEWIAILSSRSNGTDCPYCINNKVLAGFNDLATANPKLAKEWHPAKNGNLKPTEITAGSNKKAWWKCRKHGHEWAAVISSRNRGSNCPKCVNNSTSFPEQYLYHILKSKFIKTSNRTKIDKFEYDICIEDIGLLIEYDGIYWHRIHGNKKDREAMKKQLAKKKKMDFIQIKEVNDNERPAMLKNVIRIHKKAKTKDLNATARLIIQYINENYNLNIDDAIPDDIEEMVREMMRGNAA